MTVSEAVLLTVPYLAVMVTGLADTPLVVVIVNGAEVAPAGIRTDAAGVAAPEFDDRAMLAPPGSAGPSR